MNILHITTYLQGGAGRIITNLALRQSSLGNTVYVVTTKTDIDNNYCNYEEYIQVLRENNIKLIKVDSTFKRDIYLNVKAVSEIRKLIDVSKIDIIHTHAAIPSLIGVILRSDLQKKIPIIQTMHGWGTNKAKEHEFVDLNIMSIIDKIVTVSKADKQLMKEKGLNENKIECIYNGIPEIANKSIPQKYLRQLLELKKEGYYIIGCIGSIGYRKNQELLVKAIEKVNKKIALVLIGEIEKESRINELVKNCSQKVILFGYMKNASAFMKYFDLVALPSRSEGMPITIMEAFREKTLVLCSNIPGCLEIVEDGINGVLFEIDNLDSCISSINKIDNMNISQMVDNGYEKYEECFNELSMITNYMKLYKELLNN